MKKKHQNIITKDIILHTKPKSYTHYMQGLGKEVFFGMIDKVQQKNKKVPLSIIEKEVSEVVKSIRKR